MNPQAIFKRVGFGALLLAAATSTQRAAAQGTAFSYQGRLDDAGAPANGSYDLIFSVHDASTNGAAMGSSIPVTDLSVTNGLISVNLDFGQGVFTGGSRWLEVSVRATGAGTAFRTLYPRQPVTASPYAIFAGGVAAAGVVGQLPGGALAGAYSGAVAFTNPANTFGGNGGGLTNLAAANLTGVIPDGALSPNVALRAGGNAFGGNQSITGGVLSVGTTKVERALTLQASGSPPEWVSLADGMGNTLWHLNGQGGGLNFAETEVADNRLYLARGGNVGLGTGAPSALLQLESGTQISERLRFSGQEFYTAQPPSAFGSAPDAGVSVLLGVNRPGNRQLWLADSEAVTPSATNAVLRLMPSGAIDAIATDGVTGLPLKLGSAGAMTITPSGNIGIGTTGDYHGDASRVLAIRGDGGATHYAGTSGVVFDNPVNGVTWSLVTYTTGDLVAAKAGGATPANFQVLGELSATAVNITSDRNAKERFAPVNPRAILEKVAGLAISEWQYKTQGDARHIGPMAQDFHDAFALGHDDKHITSVDADGVALAAIQGLNQKLEETVAAKEAELGRLKSANQRLTERLEAVERALGLASAGGVGR